MWGKGLSFKTLPMVDNDQAKIKYVIITFEI
jgi:hypothetical protein